MGRMRKAIEKYHKIEKKSRFTFNNVYEILEISTCKIEMIINSFWSGYAIGYNDAKREPGEPRASADDRHEPGEPGDNSEI